MNELIAYFWHIVAILSPVLDILIEAAAAWIVAYIAIKLPAGARVYFDAKQRASLHEALTNGARRALAKDLTGQAAVDMITDYVETSAADAVEHFNLPAQKLRDQALAKMYEQETLNPFYGLSSGFGEDMGEGVLKQTDSSDR